MSMNEGREPGAGLVVDLDLAVRAFCQALFQLEQWVVRPARGQRAVQSATRSSSSTSWPMRDALSWSYDALGGHSTAFRLDSYWSGHSPLFFPFVGVPDERYPFFPKSQPLDDVPKAT